MSNRPHGPLAIIDDDKAELADARLAIRVIWQRLGSMARQNRITLADIDCMSDELRTVEHGLNVIDKYLTELRLRV